MNVVLKIRQTEATAAPVAWFLPGDSVERSLEELARSGIANTGTQLFIVPRSARDLRRAGVLVIPAGTQAIQQFPPGLACKVLAGRLYLPVDAMLHPPVTDAEIRALFPLPVNFIHPSFGISGFEEESARHVRDFLILPEGRTDDWNCAQAGQPPSPSFTAVVLLQPPSIGDIFGGAEEEIGVEPFDVLPPGPDEPREDTFSISRRHLRRLFAQGVAGITRQWPHTGYRRTWINDVEDWANRQINGVNEQIEKVRNKELNRLLHLLENDPEAGLRHAIPMNAFAHRGIAPPGARLHSRPPNFNLGKLGGGAADFWNISPDLQEVLRRRYREMADREMQLGRHRRAAYIYAELLGDLVSAANALKQGRLFREAALLYEEHLQNPREAARCLAGGGLLTEALERYEKLGDWLEVANLHEKMGNEPAAHTAIRRVVDDHLSREDYLNASKLVEERLQASDEAIEILLRAWPSSSQAGSSVNALLQLYGRMGRYERALVRVADLSCAPVPSGLLQPLLAALSEAARNYPDDRIRHRSADCCRILGARELKRSGLKSEEAARIVGYLVQLAPEDRLLLRDGNRYISDRRSVELRSPRATKPPPLPGAKPVVHRRFELPRQIQWLALRREWHWFYALGGTAKRLTLLRGVWEGEYQSLSWEGSAASARNGVIFEPTDEKGKAVVLAKAGNSAFELKKFPAADIFFGEACTAGTPSWLPKEGYPFAFGENAVWGIHVAAGRAVFSCYDKQGRLQRTSDITNELLEDAKRTEATRLCVTAFDQGAAIGLGNRLVVTRTNGSFKRFELPGQVIGLFPTLPHTRQGIAVMLEFGAVLHWVGMEEFVELDRDIPTPIGVFVPGGPLVLISDCRAVLLEVDGRGVHNVTCVELKGQKPIGICATASVGEFAVLGQGGEMTIYRMPR
jgi:tetratricopeptide (TPR) repeat protein